MGIASLVRLLATKMISLADMISRLYPMVFTERTSELFKTSFDLSHGKVNTTVMDYARRLLELIMIRRMKNSPGVELNLPPKTDVLLFVPLTPMQRFWYTRLLTRADKGLLEELFKGAKTKEEAAIELEANSKQEWDDKKLEELEELEKKGGGGQADWEESKEIMRQAIQQEQLDEGKKSGWKKLMNLLMQLRKVNNLKVYSSTLLTLCSVVTIRIFYLTLAQIHTILESM